MNKRIVFLVDNRIRDLPGLALVAHRVEENGVEAILEPLEAWKGCLAAYRPQMIVFNHLLGSHLVKYSCELRDRGVLVGVLPNEGICYDEDTLAFNAAKFHNGAHVDHFFCWNKIHADAVGQAFEGKVNTHVIGIPRFDYYFPPFAERSISQTDRKNILICTNFVLSKFWGKDPALADKHFAPWKDRVRGYSDYREIVAVNQRAKEKFFTFLDRFVRETRHDVVLRPHPGENRECYEEWYGALPADLRAKVTYDNSNLISELIARCDVEIACEYCTTTLESWIAGKPTIELVLERHPRFYREWFAEMCTTVESPDELSVAVERLLQEGEPEEMARKRERHLEKWCRSPDGRVTDRFARLLAEIVNEAPCPDWKGLSVPYKRKALKLKLLKALGLAYNYQPLTRLKATLNPHKYAVKQSVYDKTIKPADVAYWKERICSVAENQRVRAAA